MRIRRNKLTIVVALLRPLPKKRKNTLIIIKNTKNNKINYSYLELLIKS